MTYSSMHKPSVPPAVRRAIPARRSRLPEAGRDDQLRSSSGSNNQAYTVRTTKPFTVGDFEDLLKLVRPIADVGHGNTQTLHETDWMVMNASDLRLGQYFKPNAAVTTALE